MAQFLLIRHGQSANNASAETQRVCDPDLTPIGRRQAAATAQFLSALPVTKLFCSPFLRALETSLPISRDSKLPVYVRPDIFEQGGCYSGYEAIGRIGEPGLGAGAIRERYPGWIVDETISDAGWWNRDYETGDQARKRAAEVADWLYNSPGDAGDLHVLVIHADFKGLLLEELLRRIPSTASQDAPTHVLAEPLYNTGITRFEWHGQAWKLAMLNSVEHLPKELVSF